jgi:hypothetical protein
MSKTLTFKWCPTIPALASSKHQNRCRNKPKKMTPNQLWPRITSQPSSQRVLSVSRTPSSSLRRTRPPLSTPVRSFKSNSPKDSCNLDQTAYQHPFSLRHSFRSLQSYCYRSSLKRGSKQFQMTLAVSKHSLRCKLGIHNKLTSNGI